MIEEKDAIYSRCPYQVQEGGIIGELVFPDCMGLRCAGYISSMGMCDKSHQIVAPNPGYLTHANW